jgi:predicted O-methyltransferase YrrM
MVLPSVLAKLQHVDDLTTQTFAGGEMSFTAEWHDGINWSWPDALRKFKGQPAKALEIGAFEGRSAIWLLENVLTHGQSSVTCIDSFEANHLYLEHQRKGQYERYLHNTGRYGKKLQTLKGYSQRILRSLPVEPVYDIVYVDGDHRAVSALEDIVLAFPLMKIGGIMILDDYLWLGSSAMHVPELYNRPGIAVDAFLAIYEPFITVKLKAYQVIVEKVAHAQLE